LIKEYWYIGGEERWSREGNGGDGVGWEGKWEGLGMEGKVDGGEGVEGRRGWRRGEGVEGNGEFALVFVFIESLGYSSLPIPSLLFSCPYPPSLLSFWLPYPSIYHLPRQSLHQC
jgi:hypothetical protein